MKAHFEIILALLLCSGSTYAADRLLVVAPHPDDEMLGAGGEIYRQQQAINQGADADLRVVIMTCGDAYDLALDAWQKSGDARDENADGKIDYLDLGIVRHKESLAALAKLGVPASKVIFMGYPDGGLSKLPRAGAAYQSPFTGASGAPYPFAFKPRSPYTTNALLALLGQVLKEFKPTRVYTPTPTDQHADHLATHDFVANAIERTGVATDRFEYLIHWEESEAGWPHGTIAWSKPAGHVLWDVEQSLAGAANWSPVLKSDAIQSYTTQVAVDHDYLLGFAKNTEIFWKPRVNAGKYLEKMPSAE